jgi:hypothetical protein
VTRSGESGSVDSIVCAPEFALNKGWRVPHEQPCVPRPQPHRTAAEAESGGGPRNELGMLVPRLAYGERPVDVLGR